MLRRFETENDVDVNMQQSKVRPITWNNYEIAAIFSPIFVELKRRLKNVLKDNVIYTDGLTPMEIS